jgi:4-hydroxy-tetrahydrodipicolinate synthase
MRAHEINVETANGRTPPIAGCHHQNPCEAAALAKHAQGIGFDFIIILTPYIAVRCDDAVYDYYKFVADRADIGIVLFNIPQTYYPISEHRAKRLATIPNSCGLKMAGGGPQATISLREAVGDQLMTSVADETPWFYNLSVMGDRWPLNYCPHLWSQAICRYLTTPRPRGDGPL